jgi:tetratricopeptide (TPR) repeat protein
MIRVLTLLALVLAGCGARAVHPSRLGIEDLRDEAEDSPNDPVIQRALAFAELLARDGDASRARAQIDRALALSPDDEALHFAAGLIADVHGDPTAALDHYLVSLEKSRVSESELAPVVAEVAIAHVQDLLETAPRFGERVSAVLARLRAEPGNLGPAAVYQVANLEIELAYRRGERSTALEIARDQGCVTSWRVAGPFGPRALLGFDRRFDAEGDGPLAAQYDLGIGRGTRPTAEYEARGCAVHVGGGPAPGSGVTYAEGFVEIEQAGSYVVRLETPNSVELFVDGRSVVRRDARNAPVARITFHSVELPAGRHELTAKIASRHPNPILSVAVIGADGGGPDAGPHAAFVEHEAASTALGSYLHAQTALARGDPVRAREALRRTQSREADSAGRGSAVVLQLRAVAALSDPLAPADVQRDEARRLFRLAAQLDPEAWYPVMRLAELDAADGRGLQAIESLRGAAERWPEVVSIALALAELLDGRGWDAYAEAAVMGARRAAPDSCPALQAEMGVAERRGRYARVEELADALVACDARSNAKYQLLLRKRAWAEAATELSRLASLEPPQSRFGILSAELEIATSQGDERRIDQILDSMTSEQPQAVTPPLLQIDRLLARGERDDARRLIARNLSREPSAQAELRLLERGLFGEFALTPYRLDGAEVLREFQASGRTYEQPQVLVLDYTVVRVFEDGSSIELTHNILRAQSEESLDELGEFSPPDGANVLTLHTIKADGRRIEPDEIAGKDTVSLPNLSVGDYVEFEYVRLTEPPNAFPGGYLGSRFYFRSFEVPYDRSELTVIHPSSMTMVVDPRGPAPTTEERRADGATVLHWIVRESRPFRAEPMAVPAREWMPSNNVGASGPAFVEGLRDALADKDIVDPAAVRLARSVLGESWNGDPEARARRLYDWVVANVEDTGDLFGLAPMMLRQRTGNRARILRYLYSLNGLDAEIVLARSLGSDATESELADPDTYEVPLVLLRAGDREIFLSTDDRGAPFGYLSQLVRGQEALRLTEGAPRIRIPRGEAGSDRRAVAIAITLRSDGSAEAEVRETFRGAGAVSWREDLEGVPAAVLEQRFEEAYVSRLVPGARLLSLRISGREEREEPLVFEYRFEVGSIGRRQGREWIVPGIFPTALAPSFAHAATRETPELVAPSVDIDLQIRWNLPDGSPPPRAPEARNLEGPNGAAADINYRVDGESLVIERRVRIPVMRVAVDRYAAFAEFCRAVDQLEAREIRFAVPPP